MSLRSGVAMFFSGLVRQLGVLRARGRKQAQRRRQTRSGYSRRPREKQLEFPLRD